MSKDTYKLKTFTVCTELHKQQIFLNVDSDVCTCESEPFYHVEIFCFSVQNYSIRQRGYNLTDIPFKITVQSDTKFAE